jgi:hypothetical protein
MPEDRQTQKRERLEPKSRPYLFTSTAEMVLRLMCRRGQLPTQLLQNKGRRRPPEGIWHQEQEWTFHTSRLFTIILPSNPDCRTRSTTLVGSCGNPEQAIGLRVTSGGLDLRQSKCFVRSCSVLMIWRPAPLNQLSCQEGGPAGEPRRKLLSRWWLPIRQKQLC